MNKINEVILQQMANQVANEKGAVGYIFAWILGVPASILLVVFLLRGG